ncbi:MAG: crotonyl-CoA carboxylase/reductase [Phycisphaerales bacterium]
MLRQPLMTTRDPSRVGPAPDLLGLGELPAHGVVPRRMHASTIRRERFGEPGRAFAPDVVNVPAPKGRQVLVYVMAAGVNYNNVWAALGKPVDVIAARQKRGEPEDFHIGGSDASGVVWAVGDQARGVKVGDRVVISCCRWDPDAPDLKHGGDPMFSSTVRVWGYEDNWGSFAQYTLVDDEQCHPKPPKLTWEESAAYMLVGATAYRQLMGWPPHVVHPGDPVLIWGGAGGLGSMAIQVVREFGGRAVSVVSDPSKVDFCKRLGAVGVIDRSRFTHWGRLPDFGDAGAFGQWAQGAREFGKAFWEALGEKRNPRIVFEHVGESTIPTSVFCCDNGGMVVICGGTSGYAADVDLRYLWMRQKRLQGSHFANTEQCRALNTLVAEGRVDPCLSRVFPFSQVGDAHQLMRENKHPPGNMVVLVNAKRQGMRDLE